MTEPFAYPAVPLVRRHGPRGYANYARFRPWLRDEFSFRCVYCLQRERWAPSHAPFDVDHFLPVVQNPDRAADYANLLYCCSACNNAKRDLLLPDPTQVLLRDSTRVKADGTIEGLTPQAEKLIFQLGLDSDGYNEFRVLWIGIVAMAERADPVLFRQLMGFPDDLPDLTALRPPDGNSRPEGIEESFLRKRQRGELPETY